MTSDRQFAANRLNAKKSTGPRTENEKQRSRRNAIRHGLSAETIIKVIKDRAEYEEFETKIKADYRPRATVEQQLVVRLASLLWRLRRTTAIESGLLRIQVRILREKKARNRAAIEAAKNGLYQVREGVTRRGFTNRRGSDSRWRTKEVRHVGSDTNAAGF